MLSAFDTAFGWDPFAELRRLQTDMNRLFDGFSPGERVAGFPSVNIYARDDSLLVTSELPGFDENALDVTVRDDVVTIAGEVRAQENGNGGVAWRHRERGRGRFSRTVELPFRVDPDKVDARYDNGVLEIELHRPEQDKPRRIAVNA